jgi:hypothetical protein
VHGLTLVAGDEKTEHMIETWVQKAKISRIRLAVMEQGSDAL